MIEAVSTVLQNAQQTKAVAEQVSTADSFAANPERVQKAPQAPYISPYIYLDVNYDKAIIQLRNGETGDVEGQFPSQQQLEAQARAAVRRSQEQTQKVATPQTQSESAQAPKSTAPEPTTTVNNVPTQQQVAAFQAAAQSGNTNAGNVSLFA